MGTRELPAFFKVAQNNPDSESESRWVVSRGGIRVSLGLASSIPSSIYSFIQQTPITPTLAGHPTGPEDAPR